MSSATTELQADKNQFYRLLREFRQESRAVTISSIALVVSIIAAILSALAMNTANRAAAKVDYELNETRDKIESYEDTKAMTSVRYANLLAYLRSQGVIIPAELEEK